MSYDSSAQVCSPSAIARSCVPQNINTYRTCFVSFRLFYINPTIKVLFNENYKKKSLEVPNFFFISNTL